MIDPREAMLADLDLKSCRIELTDSPVVLLCGGPVEVKERPDDPDPQIKSLRHAITQKFPAFEIFRPEEVTTWNEDAVFNNLVDLEIELAAISSLVVIILESAGSIAELGAFSQLQELRDKLLVIKNSVFSKGDDKVSFINLGILRHIKENNVDSLKIFPWDIEKPHDIEPHVIEDIISGIGNSLSKNKKSQLLKNEKASHATTLISDLIRIFVALKVVEIRKYAEKFGFDLSVKEIKKKLYLLEQFQFIKAVEYDNAIFYCRTNNQYNKLRLSSGVGKRLEDVKITLDCMAYYEHQNDRHRLAAINLFRNESSR